MNSRRNIRIILISLIATLALLFVGGVVASKVAQNKIKGLLTSAGVTTGAVDISLFTRSLTVTDLGWRRTMGIKPGVDPSDSSYLKINVARIRASGIDLLGFVRNKALHVHTLSISDGTITGEKVSLESDHQQPSPNRKNSAHTAAGSELPFSEVVFDQLDVANFRVVMSDDTLVEHQGVVNLSVQNLALHEPQRYRDPHSYSAANFRVAVSDYKMAAQRSMYTLSAGTIRLDSETKEASIETLVLLPRYGKYRFSRRVGRQIDRFILRVPLVSIQGLDLSEMADSMVTATKLKIEQADLHVFRDKRLPFVKHHNTPLPVALIRSLPFGFALDSLLLADTRITYEEFPENGFETGHILFDRLQANVAQVSNRDYYPNRQQSVLHVESNVMKNGMIVVDFTLPYNVKQVYNAKGRISNLRLPGLNPLLQSLAFVRVESGRLNALDFDFDYDDFASRGRLWVNYENLKLTGLKKEKDAEKNTLKSLIIGIFVKKDKDRAVPLERRTGNIYYERDRRRAIFNIWVRSLMSGVRSSVVETPRKSSKPDT